MSKNNNNGKGKGKGGHVGTIGKERTATPSSSSSSSSSSSTSSASSSTSSSLATHSAPCTVAEYLLERMYQIGVGHVFGVPGDFVIPFLDVMMQHKYKERVKYVGTCNELNAAYAADGYARIKGIGALATTYVVGELSAINGVAGSFAERVPVINIVGTPPRAAFDHNLLLHHTIGNYKSPYKMFKKVTTAQALLLDPETAPQEIDRVLKLCLLKQLPVYIGIPSDIVSEPCIPATKPLFSSTKMKDVRLTDEILASMIEQELQRNSEALKEAVEEAATMINNSTKPLVIAGVELKRYRLEKSLRSFIEKTGIPYTTMMLGKAVLDESHPLFIGLYEGMSSRDYVKKRVESADCLIVLGEWLTDLNTGGFTAELPVSKMIQARAEGVQIKHHGFKDIYLKSFLQLLTPKITKKNHAAMDIHPASQGCTHRRTARYEAHQTQKLHVNRLFDRLSSYLEPNTVVLADVGTSLYCASETMMPPGTTFIGQTFYGSIGYTLGATLGSAIAVNGRRQVVLFIGDGAFQMTCQDLATIIREKLRVSVFLLNNNGYTIERLISDTGYYNNISSWKYHLLPKALGADDNSALCFECRSEGDLETALRKIQGQEKATPGRSEPSGQSTRKPHVPTTQAETGKPSGRFVEASQTTTGRGKEREESLPEKLAGGESFCGLSFVEVHLDKMDSAPALKNAGKYMAVKFR